MSEYTPTTEEIRRDYAAYLSMESGEEFYGDAIPEEDARARFDRMIAEVERAAAVRALEEAASSFEETTHAWGKLAMSEHLRARAAEIREGKSDGES